MFVFAAVALVALGAVDAPVTEVTVYSDRARVTRTASLTVSGTHAYELPTLLDAVDPSTLRVEATGAEVVRVDITPVQPDALPVDEARALLDQLEANEDALNQARAEQTAYRQQADALFRIAPQPSTGDPLKPLPKLDTSGWGAAMGFITQTAQRLQDAAREVGKRIEGLERQREQLQAQAALIGGAQRRSGYRVSATLSGNGPATVRMTYVAQGARWYPAYDVALSPEKGQVQVSFSGLVSQETGEDWSDARLTLSTAVPATSVRLPELASWKIGERDRFVPTPVPRPPSVRPAPPVPPPVPQVREEDVLRQRLAAAVRGETYEGNVGIGQMGGTAQGFGAAAYGSAPAAPPPVPSRPRPPARHETYDRKVAAQPPAAAPARPGASFDALEEEGNLSSFDSQMAAQSFSLAPPSVYVPPSYSPELPASLAGGYDLAFTSLSKETVRSGKGARRVALFAQQWPVSVERRVYPALAPEAYLVAQLKSPSPTPLPGGNAQLFVGTDPAGTARLDLVAPGETFTLPLGIDRAVKPIRHVELVTAEKGLIGRDEVNRYVVRTEIANPWRVPIFIKVFDQWPLTDDKDVEVKLQETKPWAKQDPVKGSLEWDLTIPAGGKTETSFTYTIRRPKGWRLHQQ